MAIPSGNLPTLIGLPALLVAVLIGITAPVGWSPSTYAVFPSGVITMLVGLAVPGSLISRPALLVAVRIGVTPFATTTKATGPRAAATPALAGAMPSTVRDGDVRARIGCRLRPAGYLLMVEWLPPPGPRQALEIDEFGLPHPSRAAPGRGGR